MTGFVHPSGLNAFGSLPDAGTSDSVGAPAVQSIAKTPSPAPAPAKADSYLTGRCFETHPVLSLAGGTFIGGSCSRPMVGNAGLYIGFELGMTVLPYVPGKTPARYISYHIQDRQAPKDPESFKHLVSLTAEYLKAGGVVHAGCIGGHGRTGTFLAALVKEALGVEDAIQWVRDNYCKKAVESKVQVEFLHEHYGITKREGTDAHYAPAPSYSGGYSKKGKRSSKYYDPMAEDAGYYSGTLPGVEPLQSSRTKKWTPVASKKDITRPGLI